MDASTREPSQLKEAPSLPIHKGKRLARNRRVVLQGSWDLYDHRVERVEVTRVRFWGQWITKKEHVTGAECCQKSSWETHGVTYLVVVWKSVGRCRRVVGGAFLTRLGRTPLSRLGAIERATFLERAITRSSGYPVRWSELKTDVYLWRFGSLSSRRSERKNQRLNPETQGKVRYKE